MRCSDGNSYVCVELRRKWECRVGQRDTCRDNKFLMVAYSRGSLLSYVSFYHCVVESVQRIHIEEKCTNVIAACQSTSEMVVLPPTALLND